MGDHKGAGLGLMMEILTGALAGGMLSHEVFETESTGIDANTCKFLLAIDIEKFVPAATFAERVTSLLGCVEDGVGDALGRGARRLLLRIAGLPRIGGSEVRDLFDPDPRRLVFSEMLYEGREGFTVRSADLKLIEPLSPWFLPGRALFDLAVRPLGGNSESPAGCRQGFR